MDKRFLLAEVKATGEDGMEFESVLSAPTLDRDFEVIDTNAFAPLPTSIPIHAYHDFHDPVARGVPYYEDDVLKVKGTFASTPRAQEIRTLVKEGIIGSMSVGFMSATREKGEDGVDHITRAEVLEGSFVSVPSNRESAILMAKDYREAAVKVGSRNNVDDAARLQAIHDLSTENGAKCVSAEEERGVQAEDERAPHGVHIGADGTAHPKIPMPVSQVEALAKEMVKRGIYTVDEMVRLHKHPQLDVKPKGEENSAGPVMDPLDQARLVIARARADQLLID